jgi:hypothetical protein
MVLWAYFDESGEHIRKTGKLCRLTVGGGLSTFENWQRIEREWRAALDSEGISVFHMTDFEASRREFAGWDIAKRRQLLMKLLDIVVADKMHVIGISTRVPDETSAFRAAYERAAVQAINGACTSNHLLYSDVSRVNLVFARTKDFGMARIGAHCNQIRGAYPQLGACDIDDPRNCIPLQVADLLAYEVSHIDRSSMPRYPFARLSRDRKDATFHVREITQPPRPGSMQRKQPRRP